MRPTFTPFFFHWYDGVVPPLAGVAVNVTGLPEQAEADGDAAIDTPTAVLPPVSTVTTAVSLIWQVPLPEDTI